MEKNVQLNLDLDARLPATVLADPVRLRQVLINLLSNAVKFTPEGRVAPRACGLARGRTARTGASASRVEDTGVGISEEIRREIFEPFVQADGSASREFGGTGLEVLKR